MNWRKLLWWFTGIIQFGFLFMWGLYAFISILGLAFHNEKLKYVLIFAAFLLLWFFFRRVRHPFKRRYGFGNNWDWVRAYIRNWQPLGGSLADTNKKEMRDITP